LHADVYRPWSGHGLGLMSIGVVVWKKMNFLKHRILVFAAYAANSPGGWKGDRGPWSHAALRRQQIPCYQQLHQSLAAPCSWQLSIRPLHWPGWPGRANPGPQNVKNSQSFQCINVKLGLLQPLQHGWAAC